MNTMERKQALVALCMQGTSSQQQPLVALCMQGTSSQQQQLALHSPMAADRSSAAESSETMALDTVEYCRNTPTMTRDTATPTMDPVSASISYLRKHRKST